MRQNTKYFILFIIFILIGFIIYVERTLSDKTEITSNRTTNSKETLLDDEIEEYLSYVPTSTYYKFDAYSGKIVTKDNINEKILLENIFYKSEKYDSIEIIKHKFCGECQADIYVLESTFIDMAKKMYNLDNINETSFYCDDLSVLVEKSDNYYGGIKSAGNIFYKKINFNINYEINNSELFIYEKSGFIFKNSVGEFELYKYNKFKLIKTYSSNLNLTSVIEQTKEYMNDNIKEFAEFKHIFKKYNDNYYWYSTEIV